MSCDVCTVLFSRINGNKRKSKDKVTTNDIRPFAHVSKMMEDICFSEELQRKTVLLFFRENKLAQPFQLSVYENTIS